MNKGGRKISDTRNGAVFLDRDGTLIEDQGYLRHPDDVLFFPNTTRALSRLQKEFLLFIVTNQNGVGKGKLTLQEVDKVNEYLIGQLGKKGVVISGIFVCPHKEEDDCACMKPKPFFLKKAANDFNLNLNRSYVIGDHPYDVEFAKGVGAKGLYVKTGHGEKHLNELPPGEVIVSDIGEAADWILREEQGNYHD